MKPDLEFIVRVRLTAFNFYYAESLAKKFAVVCGLSCARLVAHFDGVGPLQVVSRTTVATAALQLRVAFRVLGAGPRSDVERRRGGRPHRARQ